jgi:hypothetical protein
MRNTFVITSGQSSNIYIPVSLRTLKKKGEGPLCIAPPLLASAASHVMVPVVTVLVAYDATDEEEKRQVQC